MTRCPTLTLSKILALHFGHFLIRRNMRLTSLFGKRATVSEVDTNQGGFCLQNSSHRGIQLTETGRGTPDQLIRVYLEFAYVHSKPFGKLKIGSAKEFGFLRR